MGPKHLASLSNIRTMWITHESPVPCSIPDVVANLCSTYRLLQVMIILLCLLGYNPTSKASSFVHTVILLKVTQEILIDLLNHWFVRTPTSMSIDTLGHLRLSLHVPGAVWYDGNCSTRNTPDMPAGLETPQKLPICCSWNESLCIQFIK